MEPDDISMKIFNRKILTKVRTSISRETNAELMRSIKLLKQGGGFQHAEHPPGGGGGVKRKVKAEEEKRKRSRLGDEKPIKLEEENEEDEEEDLDDDVEEPEQQEEEQQQEDEEHEQEEEPEEQPHENDLDDDEDEDEKPLKLKDIHQQLSLPQKPAKPQKPEPPPPKKRRRRKTKDKAMLLVKNLKSKSTSKKLAGIGAAGAAAASSASSKKRKREFNFNRHEKDVRLSGFIYRKMWQVDVPALNEPIGRKILHQLGLAEFLQLQPPHLNKELCDEFLSTFEQKSGCGLVSGRVIKVDMESVSRSVKLPIGSEEVPSYTNTQEQSTVLKRLLLDSTEKTCRGYDIGRMNHRQEFDLHVFQAIAGLLMVRMEVRKECFQFVSPEVLIGLERSLRLGVVLNWAEYMAAGMLKAAGTVSRKELGSLAYQYGEWLTLVINDHLAADWENGLQIVKASDDARAPENMQIVPAGVSDASADDGAMMVIGDAAREESACSLEKAYERLGRDGAREDLDVDEDCDHHFKIREVSKLVERLEWRVAPGRKRTRSRASKAATPTTPDDSRAQQVKATPVTPKVETEAGVDWVDLPETGADPVGTQVLEIEPGVDQVGTQVLEIETGADQVATQVLEIEAGVDPVETQELLEIQAGVNQEKTLLREGRGVQTEGFELDVRVLREEKGVQTEGFEPEVEAKVGGSEAEYYKQALKEMTEENAGLRRALAQVQEQVDELEKSRAEAVDIITNTSTAYLDLKKQYKACQMLIQVQQGRSSA